MIWAHARPFPGPVTRFRRFKEASSPWSRDLIREMNKAMPNHAEQQRNERTTMTNPYLADQPIDRQMKVDSRELRIRKMSQRAIQAHMPNDNLMRTEVEMDARANAAVLRLKRDVYSEELDEKTYKQPFPYSVPATWWQHWKADHAPDWFTRRFPVRYKRECVWVERKITTLAEYPGFTPPRSPELSGPIIRVYDMPEEWPVSYRPDPPHGA